MDELCEVFGKSKNTIRRDVAELVEFGVVEKVYGGVRAAKLPSNGLIPFSDRNIKRNEEKQRIAKLAARFVKDNDVLYIDSGTTVLHMLPHIAAREGVTVLTNNVHVLIRCLEYPSLNTICFGGQLSPENASLSSNFCCLDNLKRFNINKAFMGATGITINRGATNGTQGEMVMKKSVIEQSDQRFLLADFTKFNHAALLTFADLDEFQVVITDRMPPEPYPSFFAEHHIELIAGSQDNADGVL